VAGPLADLADVLVTKGRYAEAEADYRRVVATEQKEKAPDKEQLATDLGRLARVLFDEHKFAEAETVLRQGLPPCDWTKSDSACDASSDRTLLVNLYNLIDIFTAERKYDAAEATFSEYLRSKVAPTRWAKTKNYISKL